MDPIPINIDDREHIVFFTGGNPEVHRILLQSGKTEQQVYSDIAISFRVSCIIADLVLQSSSNYYESNIVKHLFNSHKPLFHRGIAVFVISEGHGDFYNDWQAACEEYPPTDNYKGYFGKQGRDSFGHLESMGYIHFRKGKMGKTIDSLWAKGLTGSLLAEGVLQKIQRNTHISTHTREGVIELLQNIPKERGESAFIWDIVDQQLLDKGFVLPKGLNQELRLYLLRTYFRAVSTLYTSAKVSGNPYQYLGILEKNASVNKYCPYLFLSFCETLGVRSIIENIGPEEIIHLKETLEFNPFRSAYFKIVEQAKTIQEAKLELLREYIGEKTLSEPLFLQQSAYSLMSSIRETQQIIAPNEGNTSTFDAIDIIKSAISDPSKIPFVLMREAILNSYDSRLDALVEKHSGEVPPSTINIINKEEYHMRDIYNNPGQAIAMGKNVSAHNNTFNQLWQQHKNDIDLQELAKQLTDLREALKSETNSAQEAVELGVIAQAEEEATKGNGPKVFEMLSKASSWSLGIAEKIGVPVAIAAIKNAISGTPTL